MNISKISSINFNGVYLANNLNPGRQNNLGKQVRSLLNESKIPNSYEKEGKDILIKKGPNDGILVIPAKHDIKRILDDNYSRWNGRF